MAFAVQFLTELQRRIAGLCHVGFAGAREILQFQLGSLFDFVKRLGFEKTGVLIESTARTQIKRFGIRAHYDVYQKNLTGKTGSLQWPEWRVGVTSTLWTLKGCVLVSAWTRC